MQINLLINHKDTKMKSYKLTKTTYKVVKEPTTIELDCKVSSSRDAERVLRLCYNEQGEDIEFRESFFALYLSRANKVLSYQHISTGGTAGTVVDAKLVFKGALDVLAHGIILCHNHPSGNLNPSEMDLKLTRQLKLGADLLDMKLLDHIILTENTYTSLQDEGRM